MVFVPYIMPLLDLTAADFDDFFEAAEKSRVLEVVFADMRDEDRTPENLLKLAKLPGVDLNVVYEHFPVLQGCSSSTTFRSFEGISPLAFFWTSVPMHKIAFLNFGLLPAGLPFRMELGRYVLDLLWWMGFKSLASLTPEYNLPAQKYALDLGGQIINRWPGACYHAKRDAFIDGVLIQFLPSEEV